MTFFIMTSSLGDNTSHRKGEKNMTNMGKKRHTVKPFNYRLYKYSVNGETVGCELVNMTEIHPQKSHSTLVRL